jgi:ADP-ribosylglycohydrolase
MPQIVLGHAAFRDKVFACWLGKNIGGTLGMPWELKKFVNDLTFYRPVPTEPLPNDDLDLQLVWLDMLEQRGVRPKLAHFAEYWEKYCLAYPWNEYGFCARNLARGLRPPISGWFENYYVDEMGSPIRSEIWACIAPADPQLAAHLAWLDSAVDHAGGEGTYGEMFWSSLQSAAFVMDDPLELIRLGLSMIPPACQISRVIREAVWHFQNGRSWAEARERIVIQFGHVQPCNAIPNHGFTILGWLYGTDFGDKLCKAVNCAYDTDCTGATLGALLGILGGAKAIPKKWSDPVGLGIKLHPFTGPIKAPKDVDELTNRTVALAKKLVAESTTVKFGTKTQVPPAAQAVLWENSLAMAALRQDIRCAVAAVGDRELVFQYHGDPVIYPGVPKRVGVAVNGNAAPTQAAIVAPKGWKVTPALHSSDGTALFDLLAARVEDRNLLKVTVNQLTAGFVILGPGDAKGFPAGVNVEYCPVCHGRKGSCLCRKKS